MRKIEVLILTGALTFGLMACGKSTAVNTEVVDAAVVEDISEEETEDIQEEVPEEEIPLADPSVDLDLTAMSSTMIYAEVSNMMMEPLEYAGKTVKMEGICGTYQDPDTGKMYYACVIQDATQCCSQGLEFVLDEDKYSVEDYPAQGDEIEVKGTFATYEENGGQYLTMLDSQLIDK
ncbi:hypothetical protein [Pseudobutyrivibrio xylanivorans]|uniref:Uncharacterized protein n=1 Tax=Pseudobutyrivibrio xylanivorans DSM 14809 TaxID=1123012 RepID=A0A1M6ACF1_PSEXY|nr:hypothetical protein [Pseudobutyrivibrio xylanivorans]SHI34166.1 hypothetical protein SAMN02745725_00189 [Pseudobutyrivibrio xylanivorans DSM 14809]